jgi:hypothetical protein
MTVQRAVPRRPSRAIAADHRLRVTVLGATLLLSACGAAPSTASTPTVSEVARPTPAAAVPSDEPARTSSAPAASAPATPSSDASPSDTPEGTAVCAEIERPRLQSGSHLIGDQPPPVPYSSTPPTSGWHSSGHFDVGVQDSDEPLSEPAQVSVLEADGVVVAYGELPDGASAALGDHVHETMDGRVAVTPYDELDAGQVVFTSWGVLQRCNGVDLAALDRFVRAHGTDERIEPGH